MEKKVKEIKYGKLKTGAIFLTHFDGEEWCHFIKTEDFAIVLDNTKQYERGRSYIFSDSYSIYVAIDGTTLTVKDN
jgi:hypothetical protein